MPQLSPHKAIKAAIVGMRHCQGRKPGCGQAVRQSVERLVTSQPYRTCQQGFDSCQLLAREGNQTLNETGCQSRVQQSCRRTADCEVPNRNPSCLPAQYHLQKHRENTVSVHPACSLPRAAMQQRSRTCWCSNHRQASGGHLSSGSCGHTPSPASARRWTPAAAAQRAPPACW